MSIFHSSGSCLLQVHRERLGMTTHLLRGEKLILERTQRENAILESAKKKKSKQVLNVYHGVQNPLFSQFVLVPTEIIKNEIETSKDGRKRTNKKLPLR